MLFKVVSRFGSVEKIHFRSYNLNDCWSFIDSHNKYAKCIVVDKLERKIERPQGKYIKAA